MRKLAILLACLVIGSASRAAAPQELELQFHEKRIYYLDDPGSPVQLQVTVVNNTAASLPLQVADSRVFNLDFTVTTPTNLRLEHSQKYTEARGKNQPVFYRDLSLEPGEKFGVVVDLADYIRIDSPGQYIVQALFHPRMQAAAEEEALRSPRLGLNIRPAVVHPEEKARIDADTGLLIRREPLPPDEVVSYVLTARQKSQWDKFFLYLDLPGLYRQDEARRRKYDRMDDEERRAAVEDFRNRLRATGSPGSARLGSSVVDPDLQLIAMPHSFDILKTSYSPSEATVIVRERFKQRDYTEVKEYTYRLIRQDRVWLLTGYTVVNRGTE